MRGRLHLPGAPCDNVGVFYMYLSCRHHGSLVGHDGHAELDFEQQPVDRCALYDFARFISWFVDSGEIKCGCLALCIVL
jgi:hypothetical protein